ncbi:dynamin-like GTPase family protein [Nodularia harveyana UHCC-0300]|uniref:Dynamin-like GTPase family protein n=1 Tax=Nodularia harveyana UHCC-0300 TaxID=2974287 RepID=A0ABU5UK88_9CYAN|nr:dynamin-like GTPase family protein [Nodularia harveyana]MEA5583698.1 dynamin-like GTPase family protein [Nodularia harveyana UHCC-0300]
MSEVPIQCENLAAQVESILKLLQEEASLRSQDVMSVRTSLGKVISPKFEIVFAGAFSAGKSMLINALLERELLYSAEGHATGTECKIEYAQPNEERVVLTFLSEAEIREQATFLCQQLRLDTTVNINQAGVINKLHQDCEAIIQQEGGESRSERAKQAKALILLFDGYEANRQHIHTMKNATHSMDKFNFSNLKEAAGYARRGSNSAVLKRIEYYCNHPLLEDGNVIIDTPGIDAPVEKDAQLTYAKIEHPDTSAVVCVLKPASAGDMTKEETELLERMRGNNSIRDRIFYTFNRIDETWDNQDLRRRLDYLINQQFRDTNRIYKTSGLLGFYGSQIKYTSIEDRFGLDSIFAESVKSLNGTEETPQFVYEFNKYCISGKPPSSQFSIVITNNNGPNQTYVSILSQHGTPLIDQLIKDSGIEEFRTAITKYLAEEKRPELFRNLADDLQEICINLKKNYQEQKHDLDSQPDEIEAMKDQELQRLNQQLQEIGKEFDQHIKEEVNQIINNSCENFEADFKQLKSGMIRRLDELINTFSVVNAYKRATDSHKRNSTAPLLAVLVEAFYYLANELEDILIDASRKLVNNLFNDLMEKINKSGYHSRLYRFLGNDGGIEQKMKTVQEIVVEVLVSEATIECDRYVRESPTFYQEGHFSIYQLRQTLQQTAKTYDLESMVEAEPAIRQFLKIEFEPKVKNTILKTFPQTVNQTLKSRLLPMAEKQADDILQQYPQARAYLEQGLQQEAEEKIRNNRLLLNDVKQKILDYNSAVSQINNCLQSMHLYDHLLPVIGNENLPPLETDAKIVEDNGTNNIVDSENLTDSTSSLW